MLIEPDAMLAGLAGGLLIGLASAMLLLLNGRIAGISGIAGSVLAAPRGVESGERVAFLAGMIGVPAIWAAVAGAPEITITGSVPLLVAGGLLVGIGTRIGGGCTSGHGVCGLSRLSPRSLVATGAFMVVAALVTGTARHVIGG
ncbi:MAG: YeeE/YedE family protein [Pseudomonadota bacterium]|nr:YeeE/YedE family protein [Pseudomonadota bacterium]